MLELHITVNEFILVLLAYLFHSNIAPTITITITFPYIIAIKITSRHIFHAIAYYFHSYIGFGGSVYYNLQFHIGLADIFL